VLLLDILIFIAGIAIILKSADLFTSGAEGLAKAFSIPRIIIGLTIVSLATTAPEFTVSSIASYIGVGGMAIGNALGSCLANIALVLAIAVIIRPIKFEPRILKRELPFLIIVIIFLYLLMLDGSLSFFDGMFLALSLVAFFTYVVFREVKGRKKLKKEKVSRHNLPKAILQFFIGAIGVILSAKFIIVPKGISIAHLLGVPEVVIGLTMVAVGTSLPELFTALMASFKNMGELAVGNIIGANILNILWVLGGASLIKPLQIDIQTKNITMPVVFFITILLFLFSRKRSELTRNKGLALLAVYAGYLFYIFKFAY
jgi:cation:H+ antiporter